MRGLREKLCEHSHHETTVRQNEPINFEQQHSFLLGRRRLAPKKLFDVAESPHSRSDEQIVVTPDDKLKFKAYRGTGAKYDTVGAQGLPWLLIWSVSKGMIMNRRQ